MQQFLSNRRKADVLEVLRQMHNESQMLGSLRTIEADCIERGEGDLAAVCREAYLVSESRLAIHEESLNLLRQPQACILLIRDYVPFGVFVELDDLISYGEKYFQGVDFSRFPEEETLPFSFNGVEYELRRVHLF